MNLADRLKDLLRLLVSQHESTGRHPFILMNFGNKHSLIYPGGISIPIEYNESEFRQLRQERLISVTPLASTRWRGYPTDLGITTLKCGFHSRRLMRDFEARCALLAPAARDQLEKEVDPIETRLSELIEAAGSTIRQRRAKILAIADASQKETAEAKLVEEIRGLRHGVMAAAENLAKQGARTFSNAIFMSQGRLVASI